MTHLTLAGCLARLRACALAGLVILTSSCEGERLNNITDAETAAGTLPTSAPAFASSSSSPGVPFGFWRLEYSQLGSDWTGLFANASASSIRRNLDIARSKGGRVFIRFAGGSSERYQDSNGHFSLSKFKALLDQFKGLDLNSYIADGTLAGHMMLDEPSDEDNWNGDIPFRDLEEAAKYSKSLWPNLPTFVRSVPSWLAGAPFRWDYLDGGWAQYSARKGQVDSYRDSESRAAAQAGLKVVWGLNILDGGDGSSKQRGYSSGKYTMSANELLKYGKSLLAASNSCGFLMWHYDPSYTEGGSVSDALMTLSGEAKTRSSSCGNDEPPLPPPENLPPLASFTGVCTGLNCEFTDTSHDDDGTIVTRSWDYGDGSPLGGDGSYSYAAAGTYVVTLTVTDNDGAARTTASSFTVPAPSPEAPPNLKPLAAFTQSCSALRCSFDDRSTDDGDIMSRSWTFGDGSSSTATDPSRTYAAAGSYPVTLTVTDNGGATGTMTRSVSVSVPATNAAPNAYFGSACTKLTCTFTDRSKDGDGTVLAWRWTFGDGTGSTSRNPSHSFKAGGTYKVKLTVTDNRGGTDPITHSVTVAR